MVLPHSYTSSPGLIISFFAVIYPVLATDFGAIDKKTATSYNPEYKPPQSPSILKPNIKRQSGAPEAKVIIFEVGGNYAAVHYDDQPHRRRQKNGKSEPPED
jgi:hypothetical protein